MVPYPPSGPDSERDWPVLWKDDERVTRRGQRLGEDGKSCAALLVVPAAEHPSRSSLDHLRHEYDLRDELKGAWAVRPVELVCEGGRTMLVLEDPGGEPLDRLLGAPMEVGRFLRLAIGIAVALGRLHQGGLVHRNIKPAHILADEATGTVHLTGFGIASRVARERQSPHAPESLAGTLAYMAPEQTGRMNRSTDSRSDLYALGVVLYEVLTGSLPFTAAEPMEWVHCHLARRPISPAERLQEIPRTISGIVMRLLAKRAEDRYQTAAGLESDLRRCRTEWETQQRIDEFPLGEHDIPDRLLIPEKLYGRQREVATLLGAFDRVVRGGAPELVLVTGYSGIGKSSVVNELQPVLVPPRGLFGWGKFDQYKRDIPYAIVAQALQSLIRPLLSKSEADLAPWRESLREALGPNAGLIVNLVPEMKLIIGEPPPVQELPPKDAQRRFQLVFRNFIGAFARPEHPLVIFLDDLQWLDAATLDLLEDLLTSGDLRYLMLIGAYRDNEVTAAHPLMRKLQAVQGAGGKVEQIRLEPLDREHLVQLIADAICCESGRAAPLAELVHAKTGGNPFFAIQFIRSLADEKVLAFDHEATEWSWDLGRISAKGYTENVVELMVGRLSRLPVATQRVLQHLACLGSIAEAGLLALILGSSDEQVHAELWAAVQLELVERVGSSYKFIHDRVQEAAYSLIPEELRAQTHLRIGRLLVAHIPPEKREEAVFEIVSQLNRGATLVTSQDERDRVAELNLIAGRRAKGSTAYASALKYLIAGTALLGEDCWTRCRDLIFPTELERAECESLTGELDAADERLVTLLGRAANAVERAAVACLLIDACLERVQLDRAIAVAFDYLRLVGIELPLHPTEDEVRSEYEQIWVRLGSRTVEDIAQMPLMSDPESLATMDVLIRIGIPADIVDENLNCLSICKAVNFCLERGNCDASCYSYVVLSKVAIEYFRDYKTGLRFGLVGLDLVERRGLNRLQARVYTFFADLIVPWTKHVQVSFDLLHRAFDAAIKSGDVTFVIYSHFRLNVDRLIAGTALSEVQREAEVALPFAPKAGFSGLVMVSQLALIRTLRGLTRRFGCFDSDELEEALFERLLAGNPFFQTHGCWYFIRKMVARYFAGEYDAAMEASTAALRWRPIPGGHIEEAEYHFYGALCRAAFCDSVAAEERGPHLEALRAHQRLLELWAGSCPENFENRAALVAAEIARLEGRELDAMRLYEKAIHSSRANGFVNNEALAYERASAFYRARRFDEFADAYLRNARSCYAAWGADGKVMQLDRLYPGLKPEEPLAGPSATITAPVAGLDLATVIRVSQAVSSEIVLEKLLDIVMRKSMEHAGAERSILIVPRGEELHVEAEARIEGSTVIVSMGDVSAAPATVPESILRYVIRTHESVILDDASVSNAFSGDAYFLRSRARSILCLPLLNQAKLSGVLYLENNLAPRVFTSERVTVLSVLVSQAAISLQNTRLYHDLEDREAKIRRLVDANILGIFIWNLGGEIVEANDAFLRMLRYSREDVVSGRVSWKDMTPVDLREREERVTELRRTGTVQPYERELFRKDGSRVPVLIGVAAFDEQRDQGVAFVLDLTERKRAESALQHAKAELAHATRVMSLSALTASIAHEINQPLAGIVTNASTCLRMLDANPPNVDGARETARRTLRDGNRVSDVIGRLRALFGKKEFIPEPLDLNEAAREVIELSLSDLDRDRVVLRAELASELPLVRGDRVQLQQVILNLVRNGSDAMIGVETRPRELLIRTERDGNDQVRLSVIDAGVGFGPETVARLFKPFYTTKLHGMGIGLSISRSIIEAHHGHLWATANEGAGATFCFSIPCDPEPRSG